MKTTPLITQIGNLYFDADCGMSYVIRLCDGRFAVIDGGFGEYDEADHLYEMLSSLNVLDKIRVAAWFVTHPHNDHFFGYARMIKKYSDKIITERVIYSFPSKEKCAGGSDLTEFNEALDILKDAEMIHPKKGDIFRLGGGEFKILFTWEDATEESIPNVNNSSIIMMMTLGDYKTLWLGDAQDQACDTLCRSTPKEELKCDILQVGHHGYWGGSQELHEAADPKALLWPCPDFWYHLARTWNDNRFFTESKNIESIFVSGQREYTVDLTKPIEKPIPYTRDIFSADFTKKSLFPLHFSCITGGRTGYAPARAEFTEDGGCVFTAGEKLSLIHMIHRGKTALCTEYSFILEGTVLKKGDVLGLLFDHAEPTQPSEDKTVPLPLSEGESFSLRLDVDRGKMTSTLCKNGERISSIPLTLTRSADIILVLQGSSVKLTRAEFIPR